MKASLSSKTLAIQRRWRQADHWFHTRRHDGDPVRVIWAEAAFLIFVLVAFHGVTTLLIGRFYALNIPHYDSVGSLSLGYRILNAHLEGGYRKAFEVLAVDKASAALSYTQGYFAVLLGPILIKSPDSFHLYNTLSTVPAIVAIYIFARGAGFRFGGAGAAALMYLAPDGLWWWEFGIVDYRRDPGMLGLLTASFFLMLALYTGPWKKWPQIWISLAVGIVTGLTLLSRDSAALYVIGIVGVPGLVLYALHSAKSGFLVAIRLLLPAIIGVSPFLVFFVWNLDTIAARLLDPLASFGAGGDRFAALTGNLLVVDRLVRGGFPGGLSIRLPTLVVTTITCAVVAGAVALLVRPARPDLIAPGGSFKPATVALFAGLWSVVWLHGFLSFYVGWRTSLPFSALAPPYLPALVGVYAITLAVASRFVLSDQIRARSAFVITMAILVLGAGAARLSARMTETPAWMRMANQEVAKLTALDGGSPFYAEMTFDTVRIPMIANRVLQDGGSPPRRIRFHEGRYDTAIGIPATDGEIQLLLGELQQAINCSADFVVISSDLSEYEDKNSPLLIFRHGRNLATDLIKRLPTIAGPYGGDGAKPVLVLDNQSRSSCGK